MVAMLPAASSSCSRGWDAYDPSAVEGEGPGSAALCGGVGVLADDFESGQLDERFWLDENGSATLRDGQLVLSLPGATSACSHFGSTYAYELTGRAVGIELVSVPEPPVDVDFRFWLRGDYGNTLEITVDDGSVLFVAEVGGESTTLASQRYDVSEHRFLRIREDSGTVYWETSGDGAGWSVRAEQAVANLFDVRYVALELAGQGQGNGAPVAVRVDNLQGGGEPTESLCSCSALTDDFDDGVISGAWQLPHYQTSDCSVAEADGQLVMTRTATASDSCNYGTVSAYDLRGSALSIELASAPDGEWVGSFELMLRADDENYLYAKLKHGELYCGQVSEGNYADLSYTQFSPTDHRFLRFREQDGTIYFETSADGSDWNLQTSTIEPFPVHFIGASLSLGVVEDPVEPVVLRLDNLNRAP